MAFMGETTDVGVAELLSVLARRGQSGQLQINADGEEVQVVLNGGKVTKVSSSHHSLRIGRVLVRMGLLGEQDLNEAVKEQVGQQTSRPLGQILASRGLATQNDLAQAAEEQATDALSRVFGARGGRFFFTGLAAEDTRPGLMAVNAEGIVLEASRRADEIEALRRMMPPDDAAVVLNRGQIPLGKQLPEHEQRVIRLLAMGPLTVPDLITQLGDDERALLRAVVGLRERGILEIRRSSHEETAHGEDPAESRIAPRRALELRGLIGAGNDSDERRGIPTVEAIRSATPAGSQTAARLTGVARHAVGAFNAGLPLLAFAHFTDAYFRRLAPVSDEEFALIERLGEPLPEDERQTFIELQDVRILPDARISAIAVTSVSSGQLHKKVVVFARSGDRFQIDAIVEPRQDRERLTQTTLLRPTGLLGSNSKTLRRNL